MLAAASQAYDWSGTVYSVLGSIGLLAGFILWANRRFWHRVWGKVDDRLDEIERKATPNGGNTLELGDTVARVEEKLDNFNEAFIYHLQHHPGASAGWTPPPPALNPAPTPPTRKEIAASVSSDDT